MFPCKCDTFGKLLEQFAAKESQDKRIVFGDVVIFANLLEQFIKKHGISLPQSIMTFHSFDVDVSLGDKLRDCLSQCMSYCTYERMTRLVGAFASIDTPETSEKDEAIVQTWTDLHRPVIGMIAILSTRSVPEAAWRLISDLVGVPHSTSWVGVLNASQSLSPSVLEILKIVLHTIAQETDKAPI